ncbi:MAG: isoprenylcysteine carboxylmethyltransferase family protein [Gammaproteobacteria bacterium]|nr:isoprenylcysteine carboxylmethyltransferase family protein [Gammaproteobacteria bacterium]
MMDLKIPPLVQVLFSALLMWLVARYVQFGTVNFNTRSSIAAMLLLVALSVVAMAILSFRTARTTVDPMNPERASAMVSRGIFRYSRNPMYLGMVLLLLALVLYLGNIMNLLVLAGFVSFIVQFQIKPEEKALEKTFGEQYRNYKAQTRRWI